MRRTFAALMCVLGAFALLAVACGDDDDSGEGSIEAFCATNEEIEALNRQLYEAPDDKTPEEVEEILSQLVALDDEAKEAAPDEVASMMEQFPDPQAFADAFEANGWDVVATMESGDVDALWGETDVEVVGAEFEAFIEENCTTAE